MVSIKQVVLKGTGFQ